jgi:hypothetical protein
MLANAALDVHVASIPAQSEQTYSRPRIVEYLQKSVRSSAMNESDKACCVSG